MLGETNPTGITDVGEFAPTSSIFQATFSITNNGTTLVPSAQLSIFWPLNTPDSDNQNYFLYPIRTNDGVSCVKFICIMQNKFFTCTYTSKSLKSNAFTFYSIVTVNDFA